MTDHDMRADRELDRMQSGTDDVQGPGWGRRASDRPPERQQGVATPRYQRYDAYGLYAPEERPGRVVAVLQARPRQRRQERDLVQVTASIDRVVAANFDLYVRKAGLIKQDALQAALESWLNDQR
jgi:hypothetical protein